MFDGLNGLPMTPTSNTLGGRLIGFGKGLLVALGILLVILMQTFWGGARAPVVPNAGSMSGFGPTQSGEIVMGPVLRGAGPSRGRVAGWYEQMVTLPSGQKVPASLTETLPVGEHVWAGYSMASTMDVVRLETYVRCGKRPCPAGIGR